MRKILSVCLLACLMTLSACSDEVKNEIVKVDEPNTISVSGSNVTDISEETNIEENKIEENSDVKPNNEAKEEKEISNTEVNQSVKTEQDNEPEKQVEKVEKPTQSSTEQVPPIKEKTAKVPEVQSTPAPVCPGGKNPSIGCDVIMDSNFYYETFSNEQEAENKGQYYLDEVMYIGEVEITNYSVQPVYRNDHSIAYYGLNLWSNGQLIQ